MKESSARDGPAGQTSELAWDRRSLSNAHSGPEFARPPRYCKISVVGRFCWAAICLVMPTSALVAITSCTSGPLSPDQRISREGRRFVSRHGISVVETGDSVQGVAMGTWRYYRTDTGELAEEVDYENGVAVRSRVWIEERAVYERNILDGSTWTGPCYENGRQGQWIHWMADMKLDCEGSGLYSNGKKIVDFTVAPGGLFSTGDLWNNNTVLRQRK